MEEQQQQKTRAGPARNPGTPRPGAWRHGKRKNPPNNNMIQSFNPKTIYTQLSRAVTRCSGTYEIKIFTKMMQVWNTSPVLSLKREHGLLRMTPGLPSLFYLSNTHHGKGRSKVMKAQQCITSVQDIKQRSVHQQVWLPRMWENGPKFEGIKWLGPTRP